MAALDDRPRPGREPTITLEAKAWLVSLACRKAKDLGYPHELWTTRLLASHAREHGPAQGHACLAHLAQGTVCKILDQEEVKPHKVRYYLKRAERARGRVGVLLLGDENDPVAKREFSAFTQALCGLGLNRRPERADGPPVERRG
jgi:hypothetical protein